MSLPILINHVDQRKIFYLPAQLWLLISCYLFHCYTHLTDMRNEIDPRLRSETPAEIQLSYSAWVVKSIKESQTPDHYMW